MHATPGIVVSKSQTTSAKTMKMGSCGRGGLHFGRYTTSRRGPAATGLEGAALLPRPAQAGWREKPRPAPPLHRHFREKVRPASTNTPNLGCFKRAGRTFSRPNETNTAFARSFASTHETGNTFAHPQCRKIKHFVQAKVTAVSPHREDRAAKASTVSARQSVAPNRQAMHQFAHHCGDEHPPPQFRT